MAAPTYAWSYVTNLFGMDPPSPITGNASANLETKVGTALIITSGGLDEATASVVLFAGFAAEATSAAATAGDPIKFYPYRPGDVWKGTADADASSLINFQGKLGDFNSDGSLDVADTSAGCLAVWKIGDANTEVYCTVNLAKLAMQ
jgi:hypothetical protein